MAQNKFYTAGKLVAWSIMHNGPGVRCLNPDLFLLMCGQKPEMTSFDLDIFQEEELKMKLENVVRCGTSEGLEELKCTMGDWIADCGVPNIYTASVRDLPTIHGQIVTHYLYHRWPVWSNSSLPG